MFDYRRIRIEIFSMLVIGGHPMSMVGLNQEMTPNPMIHPHDPVLMNLTTLPHLSRSPFVAHPLRISHFAIENGHRKSEFSHYKIMVISHRYVAMYQKVLMAELPMINILILQFAMLGRWVSHVWQQTELWKTIWFCEN